MAWFEGYRAAAGAEPPPKPGKPDCRTAPLPKVPGVHCFPMGLRGEVDNLGTPPKRKR